MTAAQAHGAALTAAQVANGETSPPARLGGWGKPSATELGLLALVTVGALAARLWRLGGMPPGLHVDEAYNLLDARAVLAGWRPVFLPANAGRDVLYTYLQVPFVRLLGETALAARLASAVLGTAAVPATWLMARELHPGRPRVALAAATLMAFTFWPLHFSRYGIRAILFVPIVALAAAAWAVIAMPSGGRQPDGGNGHARTTPRLAIASLAVLLAAAAYAHPAGRALAVLPAAHALLIWSRTRNPAPARWLAIAVAGAAFLALPLAAYWVAHPDQFAGHAGEVSVLGEGSRVVAQNVVRVLAMFHLGGDPAPWRNLARPVLWVPRGLPFIGQGRPVFDPATGLLMLFGLGAAVAALRRGSGAAVLALLWFAGLLVPSMLTDAAPNFSRAIGALPFAVFFAALGADRVADRLPRRSWFVAGWLTLAAALTLRAYFVTYAQAPETPPAFDAEKAAAGRLVADLAADGCTPLVAGELSRHPTLQVMAGQDVRGFEPTEGSSESGIGRISGLVWPAVGKCAAFVFLGPTSDTVSEWSYQWDAADVTVEVSPLLDRKGWQREVVMGSEADDALARVTRDDAAVVRARAPLRFLQAAKYGRIPLESASPAQVAAAHGGLWMPDGPIFGGRFRLVEAAVTDGIDYGSLTVTLAWEVLARPPEALSLFVHARDAGGINVAQDDGWPLGHLAPSESLRVGERFVSEHTLQVQATGERLSIYVGWYDWRDGQRLSVTRSQAGLADHDTAYLVGVIGQGGG